MPVTDWVEAGMFTKCVEGRETRTSTEAVSLLAEVCGGIVSVTVGVSVGPVAKLATSPLPLKVNGKLRAEVDISSTCDTD